MTVTQHLPRKTDTLPTGCSPLNLLSSPSRIFVRSSSRITDTLVSTDTII